MRMSAKKSMVRGVRGQHGIVDIKPKVKKTSTKLQRRPTVAGKMTRVQQS